MLEHRVQERDEFRGQSQMAVGGMPAGSEDQQSSLRYRHFDKSRRTIVKPSHNAGGGEGVGFEVAMFPKVDFGEIAKTRFSKGREKRMLKIDLFQNGVLPRARFAHLRGLNASEAPDSFGRLRRFHGEQDRAAVF